MLNVCLGHFHPDLEEALSNKICSLKKDDPLTPVAVIVPSDRIRARLKVLLSLERGLDLMGVHFLTFHTLALRLHEERYGLLKYLTGDDFFFTEFLRHLLKTNSAGTDTFRPFVETPDGCAILWSTIEDLREAKVDPDTVIEAIRDGIFSTEDTEKIIPLILLYKEFLLSKKDKPVHDFSDLPEIATGLVPDSKYLQSFREIIYYGFYDLTQVQYDLFCAVSRHYSTTLYFPLIEDIPALSFARRFYEGYIQGIVHGTERITRLSVPVLTKPGTTALFPFGHLSTIISTSGAEDEVLTVAKVILKLVDQEGFSFHDIGVVARDISDYSHLIKRIFDTHQIPFILSSGEPANRFQVTKAVYLFISIPEGNYRRSDIIDLVSSHYCKTQSFCPNGIEPRSDLWDTVTRSIGISRGIHEWERLGRYVQDGFILHEGVENEGGGQVIDGTHLEGLKRFVASLNEDFSILPEISSWSDYAERFQVFIRKYLYIEEYIEEALLSLKELDHLSEVVTLPEFIDTFRRRLDSQSIPTDNNNQTGVQVLDVMAARAIPFKVLFILGMNEKVFPRNIREDPLFREPARRVLESGLGYKINERLYGYEEEKLLFYLLLSSTRERIYILYQRTDEAGQIKIPSWYLSEIKKGYPVHERRVPRRPSDKFALSEFFNNPVLTPRELSLKLILEGGNPGLIISRFNLTLGLYRNGLKSIQHLEKMEAELTLLDGLTGPLTSYWNGLIQRGTSPTSLEMYARCPFSYFAYHIIGLRGLRRPEEVFDIPPPDIGIICHRILKRFYSRGPGVINPEMDIDRHLAEDTSVVFKEFQETNPAGYPLLLEVLQDKLFRVLKSVIKDDLREMVSSRFMPTSFEADASGFFPQDLPESLQDIFIHGVLDRIDIQPDTGQFRVIDYKYKSGRRANSEDGNLPLSAVRGKRLQPPLYLLMATPYLRNRCGIENPIPEKVSFYFIAPNWSHGEDGDTISDFPGDCWQSPLSDPIRSTLVLLLTGIREGLFFIFPGDYCEHCDYSTICRKNHFPSQWRAERDARVKPYHNLRQCKIK